MQSEELITQQELAVIFPNGVPMPVMKMIFPEKSENLTVEDIRYILNAMRPEAALSAAEPVAWVYAPDLAKGSGGFGKEKGIVVMSLDGEWINVDTPLYAAPPAPSVAVKALEWKGPTPETNGCHVAETIFGTYSAVNEDGWYVTLDDHPWGQGFEWSAPDMRMTFDDAAKAAQADYEARILSALSAQVQDVAWWQPIETAPKDGTPVILWTVWVGDEISPDPFSEVQIGYWDHGNDLPESHDFSRRPEWVVQRIGEPTHWMPLPAAPAKQEGKP